MKKLVFILSFSYVGIALGQNPNWVWAKSAGGSDYDFANSVCTDLSGSVYVTGYFGSPSITIGSSVLYNSTVGGYHDIFLAKYDPNGNVLWAKSIGGNGTDRGHICAADVDGSIYLMGEFNSDTLVFGIDTLFLPYNTTVLFLTKYDSSGNELWAKTVDAGYFARAYGMCIDSLGHVFLTGVFSDSVSIGGYKFYGSYWDMFIAKFDSSGNILWARSEGGTNNPEEGIACASDIHGNIFVTGGFTNHYMYIGTDTLTNFNSNPCFDTTYCPDIFIVKYDSAGNFLWAKSVGGNDFDGVSSIATDSAGNVFIAGDFASSSIAFGTNTFYNPNQTLPYTFIAKYDSLGNILWADAPSGTFDNECRSIAVDENGNIYITGYFYSNSITFGSITLSGNSNNADIYVVKYDAAGTAVWAARVGNPNMFEDAYGIAVAPNSDLYITGAFMDTIPLQFGSANINGYGLTDIFLAKLGNVVGMEENISNTLLNIFPNPSNGNINILCSRNIDEIKITDVLGQVIYQLNVKENRLLLNIRDSGIYFISATIGREATTKKIIVAK